MVISSRSLFTEAGTAEAGVGGIGKENGLLRTFHFDLSDPMLLFIPHAHGCGEIVSSTSVGKDAESNQMTLAGYGQDIRARTIGIQRELKPRLELLRDVRFESIDTNLLDNRIRWHNAWKEGRGPGTDKRCQLGAVQPRMWQLGSCVPSVNGAGDGI